MDKIKQNVRIFGKNQYLQLNGLFELVISCLFHQIIGKRHIHKYTWYCYRCLPDMNCYAYQYKEPGPGNCVIIHGDCINTDGQIFERDDNSVVYIKGRSTMCVLC